MEKNKKWIEKFENKEFDRILYAEDGEMTAYYDLVILEEYVEIHFSNYFAIPAPLLAEYFNLEVQVTDPCYFRLFLRESIETKINADIDEIISRNKYRDLIEYEKIERANRERLKTLSKEELDLLKKVEEEGLTLATETNQFGETVAVNYIEGWVEGSFQQHIMNCHSSEWYGMGICQCVSHKPFVVKSISIEDVLELAKEIFLNSDPA